MKTEYNNHAANHRGGWRFRPALVPSLVYLLLLALLLGLGRWQLQRADEKQQLVDERQARQAAAPLRLGFGPVDAMRDRFRPATVRGRYIADTQWLLDNRVHNGRPGYHVFSLLQLDGAHRLLVNRGWVALGSSRATLPELPLPRGEVDLAGHLDRPESVALTLGEPPLHSDADRVPVQSLDVAALAEARGLSLLPLTLVLDPDQPGALQYDWQPAAGIGPDKHLGYAVQWFALALALTLLYFGVNTHRADNTRSKEA